MGALVTDPVRIAGMLAKYNRRWGRSNGADGQCYGASVRLALALVQRGHRGAHLLRVDFTRYGMVMGNHFAVVLEDTVYDLTARQFSQDLDWPLIVSRVEWEALMTKVADGDAETVFEMEAA